MSVQISGLVALADIHCFTMFWVFLLFHLLGISILQLKLYYISNFIKDHAI